MYLCLICDGDNMFPDTAYEYISMTQDQDEFTLLATPTYSLTSDSADGFVFESLWIGVYYCLLYPSTASSIEAGKRVSFQGIENGKALPVQQLQTRIAVLLFLTLPEKTQM